MRPLVASVFALISAALIVLSVVLGDKLGAACLVAGVVLMVHVGVKVSERSQVNNDQQTAEIT